MRFPVAADVLAGRRVVAVSQPLLWVAGVLVIVLSTTRNSFSVAIIVFIRTLVMMLAGTHEPLLAATGLSGGTPELVIVSALEKLSPC